MWCVCVCVFDVTVWYSGMDIFCADFAIQYTGSSSDGSGGGGATCSIYIYMYIPNDSLCTDTYALCRAARTFSSPLTEEKLISLSLSLSLSALKE